MEFLVTYRLAFENQFYGTGFRSFTDSEEARSFIQELVDAEEVTTVTWQLWSADLTDSGTGGKPPG